MTGRDEPRSGPFTPPAGSSHRQEIEAHVARHFGPIAAVWHEAGSDNVPVDVLVVEPRNDRPWWTLVTSGMSDLPMRGAEGAAAPRGAEVMMLIAASHPMQERDWKDERNWWPVRKLKELARMPHAHDSGLAPGHTVAEDPPAPFAPGIPFCSMAMLEPLDPAARRLRVDDGTEIAFLQAVPLHAAELRSKLEDGLDLDELFDDDVLRAAHNPRPCLVGPDQEQLLFGRGRFHVRLAAILFAATLVVDIVGCVADGESVSFVRTALGAVLTWILLEGSRVARWLTVGLALLGALGGGFVVWRLGLDEWRLIGIAVSIPLWLLTAGILGLGPGVGLWYARKAQLGAAPDEQTGS